MCVPVCLCVCVRVCVCVCGDTMVQGQTLQTLAEDNGLPVSTALNAMIDRD